MSDKNSISRKALGQIAKDFWVNRLEMAEPRYCANGTWDNFLTGFTMGAEWMDYHSNHPDFNKDRSEISNLKQQIDLGLKRESELATKLGKLQAHYESQIGLFEKSREALLKRYEIVRNALKTIKHTECDTYRVSADALHQTAFDEWDEGEAWEEYRQNSIRCEEA